MSDAMRVVRKRVMVRGRVQGVFFRDTCRRLAAAEGVNGWIRNTADGAVEAVFEGEAAAVARMVAWSRTGPRYARVGEVEIFDEEPEQLSGFAIR